MRHAFIELLTFLEVYTSAHNKNLFGDGCEEMIRHKLLDSLIELNEAKEWHLLIEQALDRSTTFSEIRKFMDRYRAEFAQRKIERQQHALEKDADANSPVVDA
jgi:hypothetical protein